MPNKCNTGSQYQNFDRGIYGDSEIGKPKKMDLKTRHLQSPSIIDVMKPQFYADNKSSMSDNTFSETGKNIIATFAQNTGVASA